MVIPSAYSQACVRLRYKLFCNCESEVMQQQPSMSMSQHLYLAQAVAPEQLQPIAHWPVTGWVLAAGVLVAARLGRTAAEAQRFDLAHLQVFPHLLPLGNTQLNAACPNLSQNLC